MLGAKRATRVQYAKCPNGAASTQHWVVFDFDTEVRSIMGCPFCGRYAYVKVEKPVHTGFVSSAEANTGYVLVEPQSQADEANIGSPIP